MAMSPTRKVAASWLAGENEKENPWAGVGRNIMPYYSPQLIQTMRDALDAVMTKVPMSHATPGLKAHLAEVILQAAAQGITSYDGLVAAASGQIQTIISMLTWLKKAMRNCSVADVVAKAQAVLSEAELLRAMFDVGFFTPNTPPE
jgi:hypothetical protein